MTGQAISHYKTTAKPGEGGVGVLQTAKDTELDRPAVQARNCHNTMIQKLTMIPLLLLALGCSGGEAIEEKAATKAVIGKPVKHVGMVVGIKPEMIEQYKALHADSHPGVRDLLSKYHIQNFSIYLEQIGEHWYEFGHYEYTGDDYDGDMAQLAREPRNVEWLEMCDPMQVPLPGTEGWKVMEPELCTDSFCECGCVRSGLAVVVRW